MNYSYQTNSGYQTCSNCSCHEEISLLQEKLREVHGKLLKQIDICREQEAIIMEMNERLEYMEKPTHKKKESYQTFGHRQNKENHLPNSMYIEDSSEGYHIKNDLLQADLQAMRHRVLTEISDKNKLLQEMGDIKKRYRRQMAMQVKKFEGLEILYKKLLEEKGITTYNDRSKTDFEKISKQLQETEIKLQRQRERCKAIDGQNKSLHERVNNLEEQVGQLRQQLRQRKSKPSQSEQSSDQLREIDSLKQQLSRINRNISQRQVQFKQRSNQRRKIRQADSSSQNILNLQTTLVGESRWRKKQYN